MRGLNFADPATRLVLTVNITNFGPVPRPQRAPRASHGRGEPHLERKPAFAGGYCIQCWAGCTGLPGSTQGLRPLTQISDTQLNSVTHLLWCSGGAEGSAATEWVLGFRNGGAGNSAALSAVLAADLTVEPGYGARPPAQGWERRGVWGDWDPAGSCPGAWTPARPSCATGRTFPCLPPAGPQDLSEGPTSVKDDSWLRPLLTGGYELVHSLGFGEGVPSDYMRQSTLLGCQPGCTCGTSSGSQLDEAPTAGNNGEAPGPATPDRACGCVNPGNPPGPRMQQPARITDRVRLGTNGGKSSSGSTLCGPFDGAPSSAHGSPSGARTGSYERAGCTPRPPSSYRCQIISILNIAAPSSAPAARCSVQLYDRPWRDGRALRRVCPGPLGAENNGSKDDRMTLHVVSVSPTNPYHHRGVRCRRPALLPPRSAGAGRARGGDRPE